MEFCDLPIEKCREDAVIPTYANEGDAGMDLYSCEDILVHPGQSVLVPTGLKMAIPIGYEVQIRPRSGISFKTPLRVPNSPGTIDCGYRDEVNVIIYNASIREEASDENPFTLNDKGCKHGTYLIKKGDRIAQMVFARVSYVAPVEVDSVLAIGQNRGGGFGSSGIS
ncbi:MAG: dUTP diphosphatase [Clostridiales bacterium]|nr:dUTP diphosphatase [Clostridiales bacterium]MBR6484845.1 dUTP diphosphatase [Clostridiales bacterium]